MAKSGMRYQSVMQLVSEIEEKKRAINDLMQKIENDRTSEVQQVYGGAAAENFKSNAKKVANAVNDNIDTIIKQLNDEAQTQHDNYQKQEERLKQNINI